MQHTYHLLGQKKYYFQQIKKINSYSGRLVLAELGIILQLIGFELSLAWVGLIKFHLLLTLIF